MESDHRRDDRQQQQVVIQAGEDAVPWWIKVFGGAFIFIVLAIATGIVQHLFSTSHEQGNLLRDLQAKVAAAEERHTRLEQGVKTQYERHSKLRERVAALEKTWQEGVKNENP